MILDNSLSEAAAVIYTGSTGESFEVKEAVQRPVQALDACWILRSETEAAVGSDTTAFQDGLDQFTKPRHTADDADVFQR